MDILTFESLICLVSAHIIGDFLLQTAKDVCRKHRLSILLKHAATVGTITYILLGLWDEWFLPVAIFLSHGFIDYIKISLAQRFNQRPLPWFILDQLIHLLVLVFLAKSFWVPVDQGFWIRNLGSTYLQVLILTSGLVLTVRTGSMVIEMAVKPYLVQMRGTMDQPAKGLKNGGRVIGQLERAMIFLFVMAGQPNAIGFLIAAKSILRFGEIKDRENRMEAEYIIIGTLMSFLFGLAASYAARYLLMQLP